MSCVDSFVFMLLTYHGFSGTLFCLFHIAMLGHTSCICYCSLCTTEQVKCPSHPLCHLMLSSIQCPFSIDANQIFYLHIQLCLPSTSLSMFQSDCTLSDTLIPASYIAFHFLHTSRDRKQCLIDNVYTTFNFTLFAK